MRKIQITQSIGSSKPYSFIVNLGDDNILTVGDNTPFKGNYTFSDDGKNIVMTILNPESGVSNGPPHSATLYSGAIDGNQYNALGTNTIAPNVFVGITWSAKEL
ncbi:MAG: hypothetical protein AAF611_02835 [Bacteroidota bacterium]